jgi:hypothetical protein
MAEDVTNTVSNETQTAEQVAEEKPVANQEPQVETQPENVEAPVENSNNEETKTEDVEQQKQPTIEELQAKIKEYEVRDEEDRKLRETLGLKDIDQQTYNYMNLDQQIVNEGKQVYLQLCNEYGIDANPAKIDESVAKLKETDPAKGFEFERRFEQLGNEIVGKRQAVQQQTAYYEVGKFANDYNQLLQASPALSNVMKQYVQSYGGNTPNIYGQLQNVMDIILPVCQEWFNAGKQTALQEKAKNDTSGVQGGVATQNTQTYNPGQVFTRSQIAKMSPDEFAKYEKVIQQQMLEGKIQ